MVDQIVACFPSTSLRFPSLPIFRIANESATGLSLLATQTTLRLKNPNSKISPDEVSVCPCNNDEEEVIL
ncbi:hypothetical protein MANES_17G032305v8 [Manihot esculenta]|uniref:Uncharacterized protein n=1 Tax=Manihot esculenta TaxID=3983 RepID=A0ACB7G3H1_MANES|nr:hypothetical protein MANES_17G032305v8 [Manihot esculenta]